MVARFSAAVPAAGVAKLKLSVCQPPATVVVASVSTLLVGSVASSTFSRTGVPAVGDQTRTVTTLLVAVKPMVGILSPASVEKVVPAHNSAVPLLTTLATLLVPPAGSATTVASSAPPKPASVGGVASSIVMVVVLPAPPPPPPAPAHVAVKTLPLKARSSM